MADYVDGDEQLQDAFEEGNGDANNDEVCGRRVPCIWLVTYLLPLPLRLYVKYRSLHPCVPDSCN